MTSAPKLEKLFALVAIAFLVSFAWGCEIRKFRAQETAQSKRKSLFRLGLEDILRIFTSNESKESQFRAKRRRRRLLFEPWILSEMYDAISLV